MEADPRLPLAVWPLDILGAVFGWLDGAALSKLQECGDSRLNAAISRDGMVKRFAVKLNPLVRQWPTSLKRFKSLEIIRIYFAYPFTGVQVYSPYPVAKIETSVRCLELQFGNAPVLLRRSLECQGEDFEMPDPKLSPPAGRVYYTVPHLRLESLVNLEEFKIFASSKYSEWNGEHSDDANCHWRIPTFPPRLTSLETAMAELRITMDPLPTTLTSWCNNNYKGRTHLAAQSIKNWGQLRQLKEANGVSISEADLEMFSANNDPSKRPILPLSPCLEKIDLALVDEVDIDWTATMQQLVGASLTSLKLQADENMLNTKFWRALPPQLLSLNVVGTIHFSGGGGGIRDAVEIFPLPPRITNLVLFQCRLKCADLRQLPATITSLNITLADEDDSGKDLNLFDILPSRLEHLQVVFASYPNRPYVNASSLSSFGELIDNHTPLDANSLPVTGYPRHMASNSNRTRGSLLKTLRTTLVGTALIPELFPNMQDLTLSHPAEVLEPFQGACIPPGLTRLEFVEMFAPTLPIVALLPYLPATLTDLRLTGTYAEDDPLTPFPTIGWPQSLRKLRLQNSKNPLRLEFFTRLPPGLVKLISRATDTPYDDHAVREIITHLPRGLTYLYFDNPINVKYLPLLPPTLVSLFCASPLTHPFVDLLPATLCTLRYTR